MHDQEKDGARRRLLQIFKQGIGGVGVHIVSGIDDDHTVAAVMRRHRQEAVDAADLVHGEQGRELLRLVIVGASEMEDRRVRAHGDLPKKRRGTIGDGERLGRLIGRRVKKQVVRDVIGQCGLADAAWPGQQQCMRQLARPIGAGNRCHRVRMTGEDRVLRRLGDTFQRIVLFGCDAFKSHCASPLGLCSAILASSAANTAAVTMCSTLSSASDASMTMQRSGSCRAMARNASRRRWWVSSVSFSKRSASPSPRRAEARLQADLGVDVEDQRQVGHHAVHGDAFELLDERTSLFSAFALVNARRIEEAVAKHDCAPTDGGAYYLLDMVGACRGEQ